MYNWRNTEELFHPTHKNGAGEKFRGNQRVA